MQRIVLIALLAWCAINTKAQDAEYMFEIGAGAGLSWAYGDINREKAIYQPAFSADVILRYNFNTRWSLTSEIAASGIKGNSKDIGNSFPYQAEYNIDNRLWQLAVRPEFNFWNYGWANDYREKSRIAPFVTIGIGAGFSTGRGETGAVFCIPIGAGAKWKLGPRTNAQLTCLFTRTFGDCADGVKDPYGMLGSSIVNSDWIGTVVLSITFDFKERCFDCNRE